MMIRGRSHVELGVIALKRLWFIIIAMLLFGCSVKVQSGPDATPYEPELHAHVEALSVYLVVFVQEGSIWKDADIMINDAYRCSVPEITPGAFKIDPALSCRNDRNIGFDAQRKAIEQLQIRVLVNGTPVTWHANCFGATCRTVKGKIKTAPP